MEKYLGTRNYIRTQDAKLHLIFSIASWLLILFYIFYQPNLTFKKDMDYVQLNSDSVQSIMLYNKGEGYKIYDNDIIYSRETKLKPVAEYLFNKNLIIVDDEEGNRFAIHNNKISSPPKGLRILNYQFRYVYNRKNLNGKLLKDIISEAGDYTFQCKDNTKK